MTIASSFGERLPSALPTAAPSLTPLFPSASRRWRPLFVMMLSRDYPSTVGLCEPSRDSFLSRSSGSRTRHPTLFLPPFSLHRLLALPIGCGFGGSHHHSQACSFRHSLTLQRSHSPSPHPSPSQHFSLQPASPSLPV